MDVHTYISGIGKEKKYTNSNKENFGVTISGKSKEYLAAHQTIKGMLIKRKTYETKRGVMRILNVTNDKALCVAIIEVNDNKSQKGHVELKIHTPGKKGGDH